MKNERQEPGPHLTPSADRIEAIVDVLQIGDDIPELNAEATAFRIYNGPRSDYRSYAWDEDAKAWKLKEE